MVSEVLRFRLSQALLIVGPLASLSINPWGNSDPISVVKLTVISTISFLILFLILSNRKLITEVSLGLKASVGLFVFCLFSTFLFSGAPLDQQFWGMFGRNTGLLAYLSLGIILFATALMRETFFYTRLIYSLIFAGVPMTIYCLIQMSGRDPVSWSSFETFGTLGNINFLSAFLGMVSISILPLVFRKDTKKIMKTFLVVMLLIDLFIIQSTGSIQGLFVFFAGSTAIVFLRLKSRELFNVKQSIFSLLVVLVSVAVIFGLANKGPLAPYLFQNSIVLRADYWHAGLEMTQNKPFFGVGMDSYGDWYREARGELSTLRGSPDRTANTAHNIFLDLSSNGGLPLLISYLAMIALAIRSSYRSYKKFESGADHIFMAIFACWIGYQVQALVSINQLGVGIWGWLLTGALIGYGELARPNVLSSGKVLNRKVLKTKMLPAFSAVMAVIGASLGFFLAWFPLRADSSYFYAAKSRDWNEMVKAADLPGSTAWHLALTTDSAYKDQAFDRALQQGEKLVRRYPRDFGGWNYLLYLPNTSPSVKSQAFSRLHQMDPFNPQYMGTP